MKRLAVFTVEEVAHGFSASFVGFLSAMAFVRVHLALRIGLGSFRVAASGAAIREARLIRFQLELF
jgi:hypothetical protein